MISSWWLPRLYEAGHTYARPRAVAHAATKHELVARQPPAGLTPPGIFRLPEVLTEAEVVEAEAELKAPRRHALEVVDPEAGVLARPNAAVTISLPFIIALTA